MESIICITCAYNSDKTLRRAVKSVLSQTFSNFEYYVIDNGSSDHTRAIIREFERKDSRVKGIYIDENIGRSVYNEQIAKLISEKSNEQWLAVLDADDEYMNSFFQQMIEFAECNKLELVMCGSDFIDEKSNHIIGRRIIEQELIVSTPKEFENYLPYYYQFIRTQWGKLFSFELLKKCDLTRTYDILQQDTAFVLEVLEHTDKMAIYPKILHKYYMSSNNSANRWYGKPLIKTNEVLLAMGRRMICTKSGTISQRNEEFLLLVYMNALKDALKVLFNSTESVESKIESLCGMFLSQDAKMLAAYECFGGHLNLQEEPTQTRKELFTEAAAWLVSLEEVPDDLVEKYCELGGFLCAASENGNGWLFFKQQYAQFLLENGRTDEGNALLDELSEILPDNTQVTSHYRNGIDDEFDELIRRLKTETIDQLLTVAANSAAKWLRDDYEYYGLLLKWYREWYNVGSFAQDEGFIKYFGGMYQYLKQHADELQSLYESLADYRSKIFLKTILQHWLTFHPDLRKFGKEATFEHYFDHDLVYCDENEVFVDCGCYIGDTVREYIKQYSGRYKSIYSYELTKSTYEIAKSKLKDVQRLYLRNAGVSDKNGTFPMLDTGNNEVFASNRLNPNGSVMAKVVKIDDDITEAVTFIKMDVEGAELEALRGAEKQIRKNKPKLAISLYHKLSDLLEIPRLIKSYVPDYKLYLRHNIEKDFPFPSEYVLLAIDGVQKKYD